MSKLWIPPTAREKWLECELPGCGKRYPLSQRPQFDRHVKACYKRNGDQIEAHLARREADPLTSISDPELYEHLRAGGS